MKTYKSDKNNSKKARHNMMKFNEKMLCNDDMGNWCTLFYEYKNKPMYFTPQKKDMLDRLTKHLGLERYFEK